MWGSANSLLPPPNNADSCLCILSCFLQVSSIACVMVDSPFFFKTPSLDCLSDHNCLPLRLDARSFQSPVSCHLVSDMSILHFKLVLCNSFPSWNRKLLEIEMGSWSALNTRLFSAMPGIWYNCCLNRLMASISFAGHYLNFYYQITYWIILTARHRKEAM